MSLWLWLWHALYLAGKTAAHSSRGSLHISFSACLSGDHWQSQVSPFLYWNSTLFVLLTRHYNDPTAHPFHLYCAHHEIRAVSLSSLLPGTEQVGSVWQVSRMAIVFVAFPSRGEAYFSTPSIWPDLVTCFKENQVGRRDTMLVLNPGLKRCCSFHSSCSWPPEPPEEQS